jgi:hypothetical protein
MSDHFIQVYGATYKINNALEAIQAQNIYKEINKKQKQYNNLHVEIAELHRELRDILYKRNKDEL